MHPSCMSGGNWGQTHLKSIVALATSSLTCLMPQVAGITRGPSDTSLFPQLLHMARLDFLTRRQWSQGSTTLYVAARSPWSNHSKRPGHKLQELLLYFQRQAVALLPHSISRPRFRGWGLPKGSILGGLHHQGGSYLGRVATTSPQASKVR